MGVYDAESASCEGHPERSVAGGGILAGGSLVGALLASACCIVPLALVTLGVSGAWIGSLTALEPYSPYIGVATLGLIGLGFRRVYGSPATACDAHAWCARPGAARLARTALWLATALVVATLTIGLWAPLLY